MAEFSGLADLLAQKFESLGAKASFQDLDREGLAGDLLIGGAFGIKRIIADSTR